MLSLVLRASVELLHALGNQFFSSSCMDFLSIHKHLYIYAHTETSNGVAAHV